MLYKLPECERVCSGICNGTTCIVRILDAADDCRHSCFCSTSNGDIFVFYMLLENKKSRFRLEIRISLSFIFFKMVSPGIVLYLQVAVYHHFSEKEKG